tara:strand:- start:97 stop:312 length:216 start_codon:yes stop_codon:yes gene_type:complete
MNGPVPMSDYIYPVMKEIFMRYLANKHQKPYKDIQVKDLSDADLLRWKRIEALDNVSLGVYLGDVKRNIVH